jgi:hypothetical protein
MTERPLSHLDHPSSIAKLLEELGREEGIPVELEPEWGLSGRIRRADGTFTYFRGGRFDLNGVGSTRVADDKGLAAHFLEKSGYNIIPGKTFCSKEFAARLGIENGPSNLFTTCFGLNDRTNTFF